MKFDGPIDLVGQRDEDNFTPEELAAMKDYKPEPSFETREEEAAFHEDMLDNPVADAIADAIIAQLEAQDAAERARAAMAAAPDDSDEDVEDDDL